MAAPGVSQLEAESQPCYDDDDDVDVEAAAPVNSRPPIVLRKAVDGKGLVTARMHETVVSPAAAAIAAGTTIRVSGFVRPVRVEDIKVRYEKQYKALAHSPLIT